MFQNVCCLFHMFMRPQRESGSYRPTEPVSTPCLLVSGFVSERWQLSSMNPSGTGYPRVSVGGVLLFLFSDLKRLLKLLLATWSTASTPAAPAIARWMCPPLWPVHGGEIRLSAAGMSTAARAVAVMMLLTYYMVRVYNPVCNRTRAAFGNHGLVSIPD